MVMRILKNHLFQIGFITLFFIDDKGIKSDIDSNYRGLTLGMPSFIKIRFLH